YALGKFYPTQHSLCGIRIFAAVFGPPVRHRVDFLERLKLGYARGFLRRSLLRARALLALISQEVGFIPRLQLTLGESLRVQGRVFDSGLQAAVVVLGEL